MLRPAVVVAILRNGVERDWSYGTQFSELYCSERGSSCRLLDYVHNVILEHKTVNYIVTNLFVLKKRWKCTHASK